MTRRVICNREPLGGNVFVLIVLSVILLIYCSVMLHYRTHMHTVNAQLYVTTLHVSLFMLLWSFIQAMWTDPGEVPASWKEFHMGGASEQKPKRYCLRCLVFKPERCHHCEFCNRCVLTMDHHSSWINNCVGFYNRKFFMLLVVYALVFSCVVAVGMAGPVWELVTEKTAFVSYESTMISLSYGVNILIACLVTLCLNTHLKRVSINMTLVEKMYNAKPGEV